LYLQKEFDLKNSFLRTKTGLEEISVKKIKKKMLKPGPVSKPRAIQSFLKLRINSDKAAWFAAGTTFY
jgi:hypothetical protein